MKTALIIANGAVTVWFGVLCVLGGGQVNVSTGDVSSFVLVAALFPLPILNALWLLLPAD